MTFDDKYISLIIDFGPKYGLSVLQETLLSYIDEMSDLGLKEKVESASQLLSKLDQVYLEYKE